MHEHYHPNIEASIERFRPLYDFCLVERLPDPEESGGVLIPAISRNESRPADSRNRVRRGIVRAVGDGDIALNVKCSVCGAEETLKPTERVRPGVGDIVLRGTIRSTCCDGSEWLLRPGATRREMNVSVGDIILWERRDANVVRLNNVEMTLLHEEGQILAVLEAENYEEYKNLRGVLIAN